MAGTTSTANPSDVAYRLQEYFSRKLLPHIQNTLVMDQFATTEDLPKNNGNKTIRFFRKRAADASQVQALTEGTPISTFTTVEMGFVDCTLKQRGEAAKITDIMRAIDLFKPLQQSIETIAEDAALDFDTITRNAICANPAVGAHNISSSAITLYNSNTGFERFAGITATGDSSDDFATFDALSASNAKFTRLGALGCVTKLKAAKVPMLNGGYVAIVAPEVMHDIRQDSDWKEAAYRNHKALYKREVIELDGVRYIETTNPFREGSTYGTYSSSGANFSTLFLGRGAYGTPSLKGSAAGSSPLRPQIVINDKADKSDPLNQFVTAGWKAYWNAVLLWPKQTGSGLTSADNIPFVVQLRTKSTFA